ncbi:hypothetical protein [Leptolyngbya sp. 7M]|uniref:hypothetical protein n=1 Tax=Leptolyngbya sp. 7M TaxID=2812896 RepID=UPI001B8B80E5|nr:hypothetical protein [Leptolyngbya sp. 7M]QYO67361.1 hypothetical protein JVX88_11485 [Leptolyngbya sp. 7M]
MIKRKSHRDIVSALMDGRNGVSYGFLAYAEPPQYVGAVEISRHEWEQLQPVAGFSSGDMRQNEAGRRYIRLQIGDRESFKQVPDIWIVSSRSGSNKTNLNLSTDILRIGLQGGMVLQTPEGVDLKTVDIRPSYDLYVMLAISLAAAFYAPKLIEQGAPIVHFHGYPAASWFREQEFCVGVNNPSVPCGTYESGVFNFLGIYRLVNQQGENIRLAGLIEPDHGTNIIASDLSYLVERLKSGCETDEIELGGRHFASLH